MAKAVLFGTFNPVTKAHMELGQVVSQAGYEVIYVPASCRYLQDCKGIDKYECLTDATRKLLLEMACVPNDFIVSDVELTGKSDGKTYHTMRLLEQEYGADLTMVFGSDKVSELSSWYKADELFQRYPTLILPRGEDSVEDVNARIANMVEFDHYKLSTFPVTLEFKDISATNVRRAVQMGSWEYVKKLVPIEAYHTLYDLYQDRGL